MNSKSIVAALLVLSTVLTACSEKSSSTNESSPVLQDHSGPQTPAENKLTESFVKNFVSSEKHLVLDLDEKQIETDTLAGIYKDKDSFTVTVYSCNGGTDKCKPYYIFAYEISVAKFINETKVTAFFTSVILPNGKVLSHIKKTNGVYDLGVPGVGMVQVQKPGLTGKKLGTLPLLVTPPANPPASGPVVVPPAEPAVSDVNKVCHSIYNTNDKIACLEKFKGSVIAPELFKICNEIYNTESKVECLDKLKNSTVSAELFSTCNAFYNTDNKVNCLERLKNSTVDSKMFGVCNSIYNTEGKLDCLDALKNSSITDDNFKVCSSIYNTDGKIACLIKLKENQ